MYYSGADKGKGWFLTPAVILGRLYSNSMMVIFNSRLHIVGGPGRSQSLSCTSDVMLSNPTLGSFRPPEPGSAHNDSETWDVHSTIPMPKHGDHQVVKFLFI